jgi:hypothetical protein
LSKKGSGEATFIIMNNKDRKEFIKRLCREFNWTYNKKEKTFYRGINLIGSKQIKRGTVKIY